VKPVKVDRELSPVGGSGTYNIGYPRGCVEPGGKVFLVYVGIRRRGILVTLRQMSADSKFVWRARLLDLDRDEKRRTKDSTAQDVFNVFE
jgi:hypothetical protein